MIGEQLAKKALETINGGRQDQYGNPEDSFDRIAQFWSTYLGVKILRADVAYMMTLLKIARQTYQHKQDNLIDGIGYLCIADNMEQENLEKEKVRFRNVTSDKGFAAFLKEQRAKAEGLGLDREETV